MNKVVKAYNKIDNVVRRIRKEKITPMMLASEYDGVLEEFKNEAVKEAGNGAYSVYISDLICSLKSAKDMMKSLQSNATSIIYKVNMQSKRILTIIQKLSFANPEIADEMKFNKNIRFTCFDVNVSALNKCNHLYIVYKSNASMDNEEKNKVYISYLVRNWMGLNEDDNIDVTINNASTKEFMINRRFLNNINSLSTISIFNENPEENKEKEEPKELTAFEKFLEASKEVDGIKTVIERHYRKKMELTEDILNSWDSAVKAFNESVEKCLEEIHITNEFFNRKEYLLQDIDTMRNIPIFNTLYSPCIRNNILARKVTYALCILYSYINNDETMVTQIRNYKSLNNTTDINIYDIHGVTVVIADDLIDTISEEYKDYFRNIKPAFTIEELPYSTKYINANTMLSICSVFKDDDSRLSLGTNINKIITDAIIEYNIEAQKQKRAKEELRGDIVQTDEFFANIPEANPFVPVEETNEIKIEPLFDNHLNELKKEENYLETYTISINGKEMEIKTDGELVLKDIADDINSNDYICIGNSILVRSKDVDYIIKK